VRTLGAQNNNGRSQNEMDEFRAEVSHTLRTKGDEFLDSIVSGEETWFSSTILNFDDDDEVPEEIMTWFKEQAADIHDSAIQKLVPRLNKYLDNAGDYVEK